ncbi:beta-ketoacyl-ACP synthase III [Streptomyces mirabilis]|uniref:beta-ketoacyl-ACP synthase III n=1 Tax=Streptomyces mirabilis TaxID=68239 RepID=UPI0036810D31
MSAAVVCGIGACLPERVVSNDDLAARLDTSDAWIRSRTGIARRRTVEPGTSTGDLAVAAGRAAPDSAGHGADFVLLATTTPGRPCPATAPEVAHRLGLGEVPAMDVSAVCSGFVYAVTVARSLVASGTCGRPLVIGAEVHTSIIDPLDRDTAVIFGDGAGAVVLREVGATESGALRAVDLGSDGSGGELITVAAGGSRRPRDDGELPRSQRYFRMQGLTVYRHAVHRMTASSRLVLERAGWSPMSVRAFVGHQADQRILDAVGARLGIGAPHRFGNIAEVGNTAAASIPIPLPLALALADTAARGLVRPGERSLLTAFGGGLTWGSIALSWPATVPVHRSLPVPAARRPAMVPAPAPVPRQNGPQP